MANREEALEQILAVAQSHGLSAAEILAAFEAVDQAPKEKSTRLVGRILGYLGGIFVFAGLAVYIATHWDVMNTGARIIITLGSGIAALIVALVADTNEQGARIKTPLYLIAAVLQPTGILVTLDEFSRGGDWHYAAMVTAAIMACQQAVLFWQKRDSSLLFTTIVFSLWFFGTALDLLLAEGDFIALLLGACTLGLCVALDRSAYRGVTPFWYFAGSIAFYGGLFSLIDDSIIELLFLALACGGVFLSTWVHSRMLLFVSTVAILTYISYFTRQHFLDSLGWPILLVLLGLLLIGLSTMAMRISRGFIKNTGTGPGP